MLNAYVWADAREKDHMPDCRLTTKLFNNIATILRPFQDYLFWGDPIYKAEKNRSDWGKYTGRPLFCHLWTELNLNLNLCAYHKGGWPNGKRKHS